jgi:hypothetical protein
MIGEGSRAPVTGAPPAKFVPSPSRPESGRLSTAPKAEGLLLARVFTRCQVFMAAACASSPVPPEFLAALTANESAGDPKAVRFEPAVYAHLKAVASGTSPHTSGIVEDALAAEVADMLHPKSGDFHTRYLTEPFAANHQGALSRLDEESLRELATSWGFTQIMGYHMVGRSGTVRDLLDPAFHFRLALELLAEFTSAYRLDPARDFAAMFRCWNTGRPNGETYDPRYVERGLARMDIYRETAASMAPKPPSLNREAKPA